MWHWVKTLDRVLRGEATQLSRLQDGTIDISARGLAAVIMLLGIFHGFCMGWFAVFYRESPEYRQVIASALKVPALFGLTLLITFPSLYVFNTLVGSRLSGRTLLRLLVAALGVTLTVLASFGPIVAFFSLTTTSYPFMVLFNVLIFGVAGILGLKFLLQTLHRLTLFRGPAAPAPRPAEPAPVEPAADDKAAEQPAANPAADDKPIVAVVVEDKPRGALEPIVGTLLGDNVKSVFACWLIVFGLVGMQMSWLLRPFIGKPDMEFAWFRPRGSHFFEGIWNALMSLFGVHG